MAKLDRVNRLSVPEIAGTITRDGLMTCAIRQPGETHWQGVGSIGIMPIKTAETYANPRDAIAAVRKAFAREGQGAER